MESNIIEYYNWQDIQDEICKELLIPSNKFRNYHKIIGGSCKDLWHEWIEYFDSELQNGRITSVWMDKEFYEEILERVIEDNKEWLISFVKAAYKVFNKFNITHIKYSW